MKRCLYSFTACLCVLALTAIAITLRPKGPYKQKARSQITAVAAGNDKNVVANCQKFLSQYPKDLEHLYVLAMAQARTGQPVKAMESVKAALKHGLPFGRFLAGPRNLTEPLYKIPAFQELVKQQKVQLIHGPVVGSVTDTSARIWVRTASEVPVEVEVRVFPPRDIRARIPIAKAKTTKADDYTAIVEVTGLKPDTPYAYSVQIDGKSVALDPPPIFGTSPAPGSKLRFSVGFGGGAGYTPWHEKMWNVILSRHPRAFLLLGDNVYIDTPKVPETQRYCYYRRQSRPEYRAMAASTPIYAIWDDHDFGTNDCLGSPEIDKPAWKLDVMKVFTENFVNPYYGGGAKQPGCWFHFAIADVDFIMLDCRYYRTRPAGAGPTMLGPAQKKWLKERLKAARGTFKVIASSVPWAKGTKGKSKDTWDGFPKEREEIFSFLEDNKIDGVVLLSADRHRSDAWKIERPGGYAMYEFESSKLTNVHTHGPMKGALFSYNKKCSFGLLEFDTTKTDPQVTYRVINIDNEVIHTLKLTKTQLSHRKDQKRGQEPF